MKNLVIIFCILCIQQSVRSQIDTSAVNKEAREMMELFESIKINEDYYKITDEEFGCLKRAIQQDVINWPESMNDTIGELWPKMGAQDTSVYVTINLDSTQYKLDVIKEYKRRVIGGFAGSFPYAETWNFRVSEKVLIEAIDKFKKDNPSFVVFNHSELTNGRQSYWYYMSLFDETKNEIIQIWIRESNTEPASSTLALVGYTGLHDTNSEQKLINRDFWEKDNDDRIYYFQSTIIDRLKQMTK